MCDASWLVSQAGALSRIRHVAIMVDSPKYISLVSNSGDARVCLIMSGGACREERRRRRWHSKKEAGELCL